MSQIRGKPSLSELSFVNFKYALQELKFSASFLINDAYVRQHASQKHKQVLKTGLHTTSVPHNNKRWCSQPHVKQAHLQHDLSLYLTHVPSINFAPTHPMIEKSQFLKDMYRPITSRRHLISSPINLCLPPTNFRKVPIAKKAYA